MDETPPRPRAATRLRLSAQQWAVLALVILAGCVLSLLAWSDSRKGEQAALEQRFELEVRDAAAELRVRMSAHEQLLRAAIGLFASSDDVSRAEWRIFSQQMRLADQYPGTSGFGYAPWLAAGEADAGATALHGRAPVLYLEPSDGSWVGAPDVDLAEAPALQRAMELARDTGESALSAHFIPRLESSTARQGAVRAMLLMAVYSNGLPATTPAERRAALRGYVFGVFDLPTLLRAAMARHIGGLTVAVYDESVGGTAPLLLRVGDEPLSGALVQTVPALRVGQRNWRLEFAALPAFEAAQPGGRAGLLLAGSVLLTLMVAALAAVLMSLRAGALALAGEMTQAYRRSERTASELAQLNAVILQSAPFMVITADGRGTIRTVNAAVQRNLGYRPEELIGRSVVDTLMLPDELAAHAKRVGSILGLEVPVGAVGARAVRGLVDESEWNYRCRDGSVLPVNVALGAMHDDAGKLTGFVGIAYDITERRRSEEYIRHLAHHDALTGLPNRLLLEDRVGVAIERARRAGKHMAVLLLDLDRFKQINDSLGHAVGDRVLKVTSGRLSAAVRHSDTVARMGGDEFCLVLGDLEDSAEAGLVAAKVLEAVRPPTLVGQRELHLTVSIGIAVFPGDGADLATLLQNADTAMYASKGAGRNGYRLFDARMHKASAQRLALEADLRGAVDRGELVLHYQPKVLLHSGVVAGVEGLVRWNSPQRGMVAPGEFITVAEDSGLIVPIGEWVLRQACGDAARLRDQLGRRIGMAVNLSPRQFRHPGLVEVVQQAMAQAGLAAEDLELEITEGVLMDDTHAASGMLADLRALGVQLAIDDFGTGFSSLSYLHRFPVSTLKIDRSFVADLETNAQSKAIAASVVGLGRALQLQVVAEGIETAGQCAWLQAQGCHAGQGYWFSRPLPLAELLPLLQARASLMSI